MLHPRTHHSEYFHVHPMHSAFSLIASLFLAALVVLVLCESVK